MTNSAYPRLDICVVHATDDDYFFRTYGLPEQREYYRAVNYVGPMCSDWCGPPRATRPEAGNDMRERMASQRGLGA